MLTALIDADIVAYNCAASAEGDPVEVAYLRVSDMMNNILDTTGADTFRAFISGGNNFRYQVYPEYKANRKDMVDPRWRAACKEFLVQEWDAEVTDGHEADDAMGIHQNGSTIICTIDKDLDMVPGLHYSWPIVRGGLVVREGRIYEVNQIEGLRSFYRSLLVGDRVDNIIGVAGIGKTKAPRYIDHLETEQEMYEVVRDLYQDDERLHMNARCLWILREEGAVWQPPGFPSGNPCVPEVVTESESIMST